MVGARFLTVEKEIYRPAKRANGSDPSYHSGLELETSGRTPVSNKYRCLLRTIYRCAHRSVHRTKLYPTRQLRKTALTAKLSLRSSLLYYPPLYKEFKFLEEIADSKTEIRNTDEQGVFHSVRGQGSHKSTTK